MITRQQSTIFNFISKNYPGGAMKLRLGYYEHNKPDGMETAKKQLQIFIRKLRKVIKEKSYIAVTTLTSKGKIYHTIILNDINYYGGDFNFLDNTSALWELGTPTISMASAKEYLTLSTFLEKEYHISVVHSKYMNMEETS